VSSVQRKAERQAQFEEQCREREIEEQRVANLSMFMRIEEIEDIHDVKAVLHLMAEKLGLN